ncbi:IclR family transcriptional regulator [Halococcus agarilyticus]|uniref:IclR family transcriptional regulator n=1 Tax=Halococcus agarilyticus TaxID=1232219 RepID=UPI000677A1A7|nr:IclR family transcriptional regulator [Halococcus agarilyticus]
MDERDASIPGGRRVKAVETTCRILTALRDLDGAGVTEISDHLGLAKATVHSHLATLADNELVVKHDETYDVSLRFVDFSEYAKSRVDIYEITKAEVERLADETEEVAQFMVEEHGKGVYLHKERGNNAIQTASYTGNRKALHCTALGKAILSQLSRERVDQIVDEKGLPRQTDSTITTRDELHAELDRIREQGVSFDDEEVLSGLRCVAAPVQHPTGDMPGAISISGPTTRFGKERFNEELPEIVRGAANVIELNATQISRSTG